MTLVPPSFPHSAGRALSPTIEKRITLIERLLFKSEFLSRLPVVARGINRLSSFGVSDLSAAPSATVGQPNTPDMRSDGVRGCAPIRSVNVVLTSNTKGALARPAICGEYREHGRISVSVSGNRLARPSSGHGARRVRLMAHVSHIAAPSFDCAVPSREDLAGDSATNTAPALFGSLYGPERFQVAQQIEAPSSDQHLDLPLLVASNSARGIARVRTKIAQE